MSLPFLEDAGAGTHVRTLPHRWVVGSGGGEYAHLVRSARMIGDRLAVTCLCGMGLNAPIVTDQPPGPWCGTCAGRELGLIDDRHAWRPRTIRTLPKKWCRNIGYLELDYRTGICLLCGFQGALRTCGGPYNPYARLVRHEHGGCGHFCPEHGQQFLYAVDDDLRCSGFVAGARGCPHAIRPFWVLPSHPGGSTR